MINREFTLTQRNQNLSPFSETSPRGEDLARIPSARGPRPRRVRDRSGKFEAAATEVRR